MKVEAEPGVTEGQATGRQRPQRLEEARTDFSLWLLRQQIPANASISGFWLAEC